jgi:RNA polymerase sigma-70 factor (ECF subfamily)
MSDPSRDLLRRFLLLDYDELKVLLARRLGSADRAAEALHDTWLRLEHANTPQSVEKPRPYLLRMARNLALKREQAERKTLTLDDAKAALNLADDAPDPERVTAGRSEARVLDQALAELSPRRRAILLASRVEGMPLRDIAVRLDLSQRMVEMELKLALIHCGRRLGKNVVQRFGPKHREGSYDKSEGE